MVYHSIGLLAMLLLARKASLGLSYCRLLERNLAARAEAQHSRNTKENKLNTTIG